MKRCIDKVTRIIDLNEALLLITCLDIRKYIIEGDIDRAIQLCNMYYPSVLENNPWIEFKLQCRKFMEMVRRVQPNVEQPNIGEYETQSLQVSKYNSNSIKRTTSEADLESHNIKKKKQKTSDQHFESVMEFGNFLKQKYGPESEHNELMKAELLVRCRKGYKEEYILI